MIQSYRAVEGRLERNLGRRAIEGFVRQPSGVLWIDLESPTGEDLALLSEVFQFHPLAVEDASKESDLPKADLYPGYAHIVFHRPARSVETGEPLGEMDIFLSGSFLVTVHDEPSHSAAEVAARVEAHPALLEAGPDRIMYEILDRLVDRQMHLLDGYEDAIDELEVVILSGEVDDDILQKALRLRRDLAEMRKSLGPQRDLIQRIARRDIPYVTEGLAPYLRDVQDHVNRIFQTMESHRDHIASLFEAYLAVTSNRLGEVMKSLTVFATIFLPLGFLAGIFGMNFRRMPGLDHPYGFEMSLALMVAVVLAMLWYFRRKKLW